MNIEQAQEIGNQYPDDDQTDPSGFLRRARLHQSRFRSEILNLPYETYGNLLTKEAGVSGYNFYNGFDIFEAVKQYREYNKPLYSNMLSCDHIPFNFFIPFNKNLKYCKKVFNEFLNNNIQTIDRIKNEYAPLPKQKYLNDFTSFDAYLEYTGKDNTKGVIGIELKYAEREYKIAEGSSQWKAVRDPSSKYFSVSEQSKLYKPNALKVLPDDKFRQIWRNHLLGESILLTNSDKFRHFTSLTLFPKGNSHLVKTSMDYIELLVSNDYKFLPVTFEEFFSACDKHCPDKDYAHWLEYLSKRYIVKDDIV